MTQTPPKKGTSMLSIAILVILLATSLVLAYLSFAYYSELKWAEDEIRALRNTIDAMHANRETQPSKSNLSETLILRK